MCKMKTVNNANRSISKHSKYQAGVGLLEVMITMLVLSIGLIGVASLQLHALQANQNSLQRSQAVNLTYDLMDRLRANRDIAINDNDYLTNQLDGQRFQNNYTLTGQCNAAVLAHDNNKPFSENDLNSWINSVRCTLPQGHARIERDDATNQYTITVRWSSVNLEGSENQNWESFRTRTAL